MRASSRALVALLALALCAAAEAFYLPGVAPQDYARDDIVYMKVNKLSSTKTQLPYEYYLLPFCQPENMETVAENLGEVLRGDKIMNSMYELKMGALPAPMRPPIPARSRATNLRDGWLPVTGPPARRAAQASTRRAKCSAAKS